MRRLFVIFICIVAIYCAGCAAPGRYLKNRANDFADCFKADVGVGFGVDAQVKITEYIVTGLGASVSNNIGFEERKFIYPFRCVHIGIPVSLLYSLGAPEEWPIYITDTGVRIFNEEREKTNQISLSQYSFGAPYAIYENKESTVVYDSGWSGLAGLSIDPCEANDSIVFVNVVPLMANPPNLIPFTDVHQVSTINRFDVKVGGTLGVINAHAGFSLGQFLDFILGIAGIDIANDDEKIGVTEHKEKQEPNK